MKKVAILLVAGVAVGASAPASADVMTFNGTEPDGGNTGRSPGYVYTEGDYQYEAVHTSGQVFTLDNNQGNFDAADDDTVFLQNGGGGAMLTFTHVLGDSFDAPDVDSIGGFSDGDGTLLFTGHFTAGGTISLAVPVSNGVITNTALAGFVGLSSLDVEQTTATGNFLALDNITLTASGTRLIKFELPETGERDLTSVTITSDGVDLTIDNPNGNTMFGDDTFAFILGGLFIDGGLAPNLDWTFSEDVRLVEYTIANQDDTDLFDLVQGGTSSLRQRTDPIATFPFNNTVDVFSGGQAISLTTSDHSGGGYSINSIVVEVVPGGGCPADIDGDGDVDADDFFAFLDAFAGGDLPVCDIDGDGDCDADDFFGYLDLFAQGC